MLVFNLLLAVGISLVFLYLKPVTISCIGCGESGLFHKCREGTGRGSKTCDNIEDGQVFLNNVGTQIDEIRGRISTLQADILEPVEKTKQAIAAISEDIKNAIPPMNIKPLKANIGSCDIPGIGDPCKGLNDGLSDTLSVLNIALEEVSKGMNVVIGELNKVFSLILLPLQQKLQRIFTTIVSPWIDIKDDAVGLVSDVQELMGSVSAVGIGNIITASIASRINAVFPFMSVGLALALAGILMLMWMLGGFFGAIMMIDKLTSSVIWTALLPFKAVQAVVGMAT